MPDGMPGDNDGDRAAAYVTGVMSQLQLAFPTETVAKVLSMDMFEDGTRFHISGRQDAPLFKTFESELIGAVINAVIQGDYSIT